MMCAQKVLSAMSALLYALHHNPLLSTARPSPHCAPDRPPRMWQNRHPSCSITWPLLHCDRVGQSGQQYKGRRLVKTHQLCSPYPTSLSTCLITLSMHMLTFLCKNYNYTYTMQCSFLRLHVLSPPQCLRTRCWCFQSLSPDSLSHFSLEPIATPVCSWGEG